MAKHLAGQKIARSEPQPHFQRAGSAGWGGASTSSADEVVTERMTGWLFR